MNARNILKIVGIVIGGGALFAAGYLWGAKKIHEPTTATQPSAPGSEMAGMNRGDAPWRERS